MYSGILVIDKPKDFTSHDVIAVLRGILGMRRIGHGGTLDPMATGVLPVFLGAATRVSGYAAAHDKEYVVRFQLGLSTDTQDITGKVMKTARVKATGKDVEEALASFVGKIMQVPPMFSAVKKDGKRLYEYARRGMTVEREARPVTIFKTEIISSDEESSRYDARIVCSSGTYIRTLCSDVGDRLGCFAVMTDLQRTRSGMFFLADALTLKEAEQLAKQGEIRAHILTADMIFSGHPEIRVDSYGESRIRNGAFVPLSSIAGPVPQQRDGLFRVYAKDGSFLMLGRFKPLNTGGQALFCEKNFFS